MVEVTLELSDPGVMQSKHTISHIFHKTLIKYNCNRLEENDEEEKESIDIELIDKKIIIIMMKMLLTLNDLIYKKKMRKKLLWLT